MAYFIPGVKQPRKRKGPRHAYCGKVCGKSRARVADGRTYIPALPPGIRRAGEKLLKASRP